MKRRTPAIAAVATAALFSASGAQADFDRVPAQGSVEAVTNRLAAAVEGAGARVFARVDHAAGAAEAGMELRPAQLLVFGNPKLGTPAMQDDPRAGLMLPLRVLVYEDEDGQVWLTYEEVEEMFDDLDIDDDADYVERMEDALENLTDKAAKD